MTKLITTTAILLIATAGYAQGEVYTEAELKVQLPFGEANSTESSKTYTVERVIDGDTLKLTNGEEVQMIGIKAPEDEKMGQEATEYMELIISVVSTVHLEFDVQERDKYGRLLAYVFLDSGISGDSKDDPMLEGYRNIHFNINGTWHGLVNALMIADGFATPMTIPPNVKYADLFQELYEEARENERGLWKPKGRRIIKPIGSPPQVRDNSLQNDLDGDGDCDNDDEVLFNKYLGNCLDGNYCELCDANHDGCVTEEDRKELFPCGENKRGLWKEGVSDKPRVACTMDAKICPDGSAVGRTGPNCEFAPCPG